MGRNFQPLGNRASIGIVSALFGSLLASLNMVGWLFVQGAFLGRGDLNASRLIIGFYTTQAIAVVIVVIGLYYTYKGLGQDRLGDQEKATIATVISRALASKTDVRKGIIAASVYAIIYSVVSGVIVYQPSVDFLQAYGVSSPGWSAVACCGSLGTTPVLIAYLLPQHHTGLQLIPLNLIFAAVIPILVGFNVSLTTYAFRTRPSARSGRWLGGMGALIGLFTACPSCAGFFLASSLGGLGAVTLAIALAPYQTLFISISLPVLLLSPLLVAKSTRDSLNSNCELRPVESLRRL